MNIQEYLSRHEVLFFMIQHPATATAQQLAEILHEHGDHVAKTVVLKTDKEYVLGVLQATRIVDLQLAREVLEAKTLKLAVEEELREIFYDCQLGAAPPFGRPYGLRTIVDEPLTHDEFIFFEGNNHEEAIYMRYADYAAIEQPRVKRFTRHEVSNRMTSASDR